jgi:hypothetical protein
LGISLGIWLTKSDAKQQANLLRCLNFLRDIQHRTATEVINTPFGVAFFNRDFPDKHDLNVFWTDRLAPQLDAGVLTREVSASKKSETLRTEG